MKKSLFFFIGTVICWVLVVMLVVRFAKTIATEADASLAVVEAPGSVIFPVEEAGQISLWHNYQEVRDGKTVSHDPLLPGGFGFELKELGSGAVAPFFPTGADVNLNNPRVSKKGIGNFDVTTAGDYEFTVTAPPGQSRVLSLRQGTMKDILVPIFGLAGTAVLFGLVGFVFLVIGIVMLFTNRKPQSKPPLSAHAS